MRVFINRKKVSGPWGGENSFIGSLTRWMGEQGVTVVTNINQQFDVALLNALTHIDLSFVKSINSRGIPIVHRKTGFTCSGSAEMRKKVRGVVVGDQLQIDFSPYINHTIFQSKYSKNLFESQGFSGPNTIIYNGVDTSVFNPTNSAWLTGKVSQRSYWKSGQTFRILCASWSRDLAKGFTELEIISRRQLEFKDVNFSFVGNKPDDINLDGFKIYKPQPHRKLAKLYRDHHALLFLGRDETCSNTILEGINSGMAIIYHPSGANIETAKNYGVEYTGNLHNDVKRIKAKYQNLRLETADNPFKIAIQGPKYLKILQTLVSHADHRDKTS